MSAAPLFQPVSWLKPEQEKQQGPHGRLLREVLNAREVVGGATEVFALLQREDLDANFNDDNGQPLPALMSPATREELVRMAATSLRLLRDRLDGALEADAQSLMVSPWSLAGARAVALASLLPEAPCAGRVLTVDEADGLARLRGLLLGKAVQQ